MGLYRQKRTDGYTAAFRWGSRLRLGTICSWTQLFRGIGRCNDQRQTWFHRRVRPSGYTAAVLQTQSFCQTLLFFRRTGSRLGRRKMGLHRYDGKVRLGARAAKSMSPLLDRLDRLDRMRTALLPEKR